MLIKLFLVNPLKLKHSWLISLLATMAAVFLLHYQISSIGYNNLLVQLRAIPQVKIAGAMVATAASFTLLALSEWLACRQVVGGRISARRATFTGATSNALSNTLGFHAFTGGALRYRLYAAAHISLGDTSRIFSIVAMGLGFGFACTVALSLIAAPGLLGPTGTLIGLTALVAISGIFIWLSDTPRTLKVVRWQLLFPTRRTAAMLAIIGVVEMLMAIAALYLLLPAEGQTGFLEFCLDYIIAIFAGLISTVPGGIGVFETVVLVNYDGSQQAAVMASLVAYRLIYNLLPFALTVLMLLIHELSFAAAERRR